MFKSKNNIFQNWNKDMYIATKKSVSYDDYNNEIVEYNKPFYFGRVNYQPLTKKDLEAYIKAFGETNNNIVSCLIDYTDATPKGEIKYGDKANYLVRSYKPQNTKIMVIFEEIIKEEN